MRGIWDYYRKAFSGLPRGVWAFSLVLLIHRSGTMVLPFLSLHLKDHLGLSASAAAQLLSCYGIGSICGSLGGGMLTARFGPIRVLIVGFVAVAPIFLMLLYSQTLPTAAISILLLSLVGDTVRPAAMTATADLCEGRLLSRAFALNRLAINVGMSIGPAVAGFLYLHHFQWIFYLDATSCLFAAALVAWLFGWPATSNQSSKAERRQHIPSLWHDPLILSVLALFCLVMVIFLQTIACYPIFLRESHGISEASIGLLFTINTGLIVLFEMVLIARIERYPKLPIIGLGCTLMCLGLGLLPFGQGIGFVGFTVVIWTIGEMLSMPLLTTWVGERAPAERRGQYMGAMTALFSVAWVIAPVFGGAMYNVAPNAIWYVSLGLGLLVAVGFAYASRVDARPAPHFIADRR